MEVFLTFLRMICLNLTRLLVLLQFLFLTASICHIAEPGLSGDIYKSPDRGLKQPKHPQLSKQRIRLT